MSLWNDHACWIAKTEDANYSDFLLLYWLFCHCKGQNVFTTINTIISFITTGAISTWFVFATQWAYVLLIFMHTQWRALFCWQGPRGPWGPKGEKVSEAVWISDSAWIFLLLVMSLLRIHRKSQSIFLTLIALFIFLKDSFIIISFMLFQTHMTYFLAWDKHVQCHFFKIIWNSY